MFINRPITEEAKQNIKEGLLYGLSIQCQLPHLVNLFEVAVNVIKEYPQLRINLQYDKYNSEHPYTVELLQNANVVK